MALGTLGELRTEALGPRTDLVARFPAMVALAEQRMFYGEGDVPPLRVLPMEASEDLSFVDGEAELPADFLDKRALYWEGAYTASLSYEPPGVFYPMGYQRRGGSMPMAYTIEGNTVKISPALTGDAKLLYYQRPLTLSDGGDSTTNDILKKWPGVYLHGTQIELYRITRNNDELAKSLQMYAASVRAANIQQMTARSVGGPMKRRAGFPV